jgi:hypothetical protein
MEGSDHLRDRRTVNLAMTEIHEPGTDTIRELAA